MSLASPTSKIFQIGFMKLKICFSLSSLLENVLKIQLYFNKEIFFFFLQSDNLHSQSYEIFTFTDFWEQHCKDVTVIYFIDLETKA
jgi:hypothetical protein